MGSSSRNYRLIGNATKYIMARFGGGWGENGDHIQIPNSSKNERKRQQETSKFKGTGFKETIILSCFCLLLNERVQE